MRSFILTAAAALAAVTAPVAAPVATWAHVVASPDHASAGGYYAGELRISHGCDGSPTTAVSVAIPPDVASAKPQPKPGWTLTIDREPLPQPIKGEGGQVVRDRAVRLTWRGGPLPNDEFESFGIMLKLPARPGPLYLPVTQTCERGETRWTNIPAAGQAWHDVPNPAPVITLAPAADPMAGMAGMHH